jgi:hypothetical protein
LAQHRSHESRLSVVDVRNNRDVPNVFSFKH